MISNEDPCAVAYAELEAENLSTGKELVEAVREAVVWLEKFVWKRRTCDGTIRLVGEPEHLLERLLAALRRIGEDA